MPNSGAKSPESDLREREIAVKEAEVAVRQQELRARIDGDRRGRWAAPLVAAIVAATIAGAANVWVSYYNADQARAAERDRNLSTAATEFARLLTRACQQQEWVLWKAVNDGSFSEADVKAFDAAMGELLPNLLASHVLLATQNRKLYDAVNPLVNAATALDARVAAALRMRGGSNLSKLNDLLREANETRSRVGPGIAAAFAGQR